MLRKSNNILNEMKNLQKNLNVYRFFTRINRENI